MDIARIGFSADTAALNDAKASLEALVPAAKRVEKAADDVGRAATSMGSKFSAAAAGGKAVQGSFAAAATGATGLNRSALMAGTAMGTVQSAASGAATILNVLGTAAGRTGSSFAAADAHIIAYRAHLAAIPGAADNAKSSLDRLGAAANDNINAMQATPGNIAAQFQDIGVTAAGGMSPLLIALQQGTQLSAAFAGGGLKSLGAALKQVFSPAALLTIAVVALVAYLIQLTMEFFTASDGADALTTAIDKTRLTTSALGDIQSALGNVMDLTTGKVISQSDAMWGLAEAQLAVIEATALRDQSEARRALTEEIKPDFSFMKALTIGLTGPEEGGLSNLAMETSAAQGVLQQFMAGDVNPRAAIQQLRALEDAGAITEDRLVSLVGAVSNFSVATENLKLTEGGIEALAGDRGALGQFLTPPEARTPRATRDEPTNADKYADVVKGINTEIAALQVEAAALGMSESAARLYRNEQAMIANVLSQNITLTADMRTELGALAAVKTELELSNAFDEMTKSAEAQLAAQRAASDEIGLYGLELEYARARQDLLNKAIADGTIGTGQLTDVERERLGVLSGIAMQIANQTMGDRNKEFMADAVKDHEQQMYMLEREQGGLGLTGAALAAYRYETELLTAAKRQKLALEPAELAAFALQAEEYGRVTDAMSKQREELEFQRTTFKGLFTDMKAGLQQGKSAWEAFSDAITNMLNRILDRMIDVVLDDAFAQLTGGGKGGGGLMGILNTVGSLIGAASGGGGGGAMNSFTGGISYVPHAKGGAFTNGIYDSPTMFKFANGGSFGMMGEAGPEAVMPLKRGPDGSLGVQMHDSGGSSPAGGGGELTIRLSPGLEAEWLSKSAGQTVEIIGVVAPTMISTASTKARRDAARPMTPGGRTG